jgi:hypothetical protein
MSIQQSQQSQNSQSQKHIPLTPQIAQRAASLFNAPSPVLSKDTEQVEYNTVRFFQVLSEMDAGQVQRFFLSYIETIGTLDQTILKNILSTTPETLNNLDEDVKKTLVYTFEKACANVKELTRRTKSKEERWRGGKKVEMIYTQLNTITAGFELATKVGISVVSIALSVVIIAGVVFVAVSGDGELPSSEPMNAAVVPVIAQQQITVAGQQALAYAGARATKNIFSKLLGISDVIESWNNVIDIYKKAKENEKDIEKQLLEWNMINPKYLNRYMVEIGGKKISKHSKTSKKHIDKNNISRVVYVKGDKEYIKKKDKHTNKFKYVKI